MSGFVAGVERYHFKAGHKWMDVLRNRHAMALCLSVRRIKAQL